MKTHIIRLLAVTVLVMAGSACLEAQTRAYYVNFAYDADGNRVSRTITLGDDREDRGPSADTTAYYTDYLEECEISIYPNPTSGMVKVGMTQQPDGKTLTATLYSPIGVQVTRREMTSVPAEFDLGGMAAGTYILELRCGDETRTWKIIKR